MKWIVIWWMVSCVQCDSYFATKGKEPCYEPRRAEHFQMFDDEMEAASFVSAKITDGYDVKKYYLDQDGTLELWRKANVLRVLEEFAEMTDTQSERAGISGIEMAELDEFIKDLKSGNLELYAPKGNK